MKILLRGYADPFRPLTATKALHRRRLGSNSGNLIFAGSAHRTLLTDSNEVTLDHFRRVSDRTAEINEQYDHAVIPLANAFRPPFLKYLNWLTAFMQKSTIPVTILGVGAQGDLDYNFDRLGPIEDDVKAFVSAVLDRGPSIGVRGEATATYLRGLGFSDVEVIGCPSMFFNGPHLNVGPGPERFDRTTRIALNATVRVEQPENYIRDHFARFPRTTYVAQESPDLVMMLGGPPVSHPDADFPGHLKHPALDKDKTRFYLHPVAWINDMKSFDFSFGSRIHGNVAPLLAGIPAHVIAHDSRTLELAEYFQIPHTRRDRLTAEMTADQLFAASDYAPTMAGHAGRFATFTGYLDRHGLDHIHRHPDVEPEFDRRVAEAGIGRESIVRVRSTDLATMSERVWQTTTYTHELLERVAGVQLADDDPGD